MTTSKTMPQTTRSAKPAHVVTHRGVKITSIEGERSAAGKVLRDALFDKVGPPHGKRANA